MAVVLWFVHAIRKVLLKSLYKLILVVAKSMFPKTIIRGSATQENRINTTDATKILHIIEGLL